MKKIEQFLTEEERAAIKNAVHRAEAGTSGELKVLVVGASSRPWDLLRNPAKAVRARALREFKAMGIGKTADHTGILIMLSLKERRVEVVADKGIDGKVTQKTWGEVVKLVTSHVKDGKQAEGIIRAVDYAGKILAEHFPAKKDGGNEISDDVEFKE